MIEVQEEKYVWEDLLHGVSKVLSEIGDGRAQVKETDRALKYIEANGLESMNYEATRKALSDVRDYELRKRVNLG